MIDWSKIDGYREDERCNISVPFWVDVEKFKTIEIGYTKTYFLENYYYYLKHLIIKQFKIH